MLLNSNLKLKKNVLNVFSRTFMKSRSNHLFSSFFFVAFSPSLCLSVSWVEGEVTWTDKARHTYLYRVVVSRSCTGQHPLLDIRHPVLPLIFTRSNLLVFCFHVLFHQMHSRHSCTSFLPSSQTSKVGLKSVCHPPSSSSSHEGSNIILGGRNTLWFVELNIGEKEFRKWTVSLHDSCL